MVAAKDQRLRSGVERAADAGLDRRPRRRRIRWKIEVPRVGNQQR
jgi:hypothetical protein